MKRIRLAHLSEAPSRTAPPIGPMTVSGVPDKRRPRFRTAAGPLGGGRTRRMAAVGNQQSRKTRRLTHLHKVRLRDGERERDLCLRLPPPAPAPPPPPRKAAVSHFTPTARTCCQMDTAATSRSAQPGCLVQRVGAHSSASTRPDGWWFWVF